MVGFLTWWMGFALGTFMWLIVSETVIVMVRGASWWMEIRKRLGESKATSWFKGALHILFLWWAMLLIWAWAALKGRSLMEHMVWMKEDTERMDAEIKRMEAEKERLHQERLRLKAEKLTAELRKSGWTGDFRIEIIKGPDGEDQILVELPRDENGIPLFPSGTGFSIPKDILKDGKDE